MSSKRLLPFIIGLVILVGLILAPFLLFHPERYRPLLIQKMSAAFGGHSVLIGKIEGGYFPPSLTIHDVSVLKTPDIRYGHIDAIQAQLGWAALTSPQAPFQDITISGFQATFSRRVDGTWDTEEWWPKGGSNLLGSAGHTTVNFHAGELHWIDAYAPGRTDASASSVDGQWQKGSELSLKGNLSGALLPATFTLQTSGLFGKGDGGGELKISESNHTALIKLERHGDQWSAQGESAEWRLDHAWSWLRFAARLRPNESPAAGSSLLRQWSFSLKRDGTTQLFTHHAALDGGMTEANAKAQMEGPLRVWRGSLAVQQVPVTSLATVAGTWISGLDGKVTALFKDFAVPVSSLTWVQSTGILTAQLSDGSYRLPAASVKLVQKAKTTAYMRKKFPELEEKGLPILRSQLEGRLEKGGWTIDYAGARLGDVSAAFTGRVESSPKSVDGYVQLQIRERLSHLIKELPERYVYGDPGEEKIQPIFGRVQGVWDEWKLRAASHSKVPGAALRKLRTGLNLK